MATMSIEKPQKIKYWKNNNKIKNKWKSNKQTKRVKTHLHVKTIIDMTITNRIQKGALHLHTCRYININENTTNHTLKNVTSTFSNLYVCICSYDLH